jgi:hypothetical protein
MQVRQISDPSDMAYPFTKSLYEDPHVVYHGTCSGYAADIDGNGFRIGSLPFSVDNLIRMTLLADQLGLGTWSRTVVGGLARGNRLARGSHRAVFFSGNYWFARDYATNIGGETGSNALNLANELIAQLRDGGEKEDELVKEVLNYREELLTRIANSHPVVYAVFVKDEWLQGASRLERKVLGDLVEAPINLACEQSVPMENLLAKAEFVNGADPGYCGPQPVTWEEARRFGFTAS